MVTVAKCRRVFRGARNNRCVNLLTFYPHVSTLSLPFPPAPIIRSSSYTLFLWSVLFDRIFSTRLEPKNDVEIFQKILQSYAPPPSSTVILYSSIILYPEVFSTIRTTICQPHQRVPVHSICNDTDRWKIDKKEKREI